MLKYPQCVKSRSNLLRIWYLGYMQYLDRLTGWLRNMNHITLKFWRLLFVTIHKFEFFGPLQHTTLGLLSHIEPFCSIQVFSFVFACMNLASCLFGHLCLKISIQNTFGFRPTWRYRSWRADGETAITSDASFNFVNCQVCWTSTKHLFSKDYSL